MSKKINKLHNMQIDEISLVDRAANQHSLVSFAKNDDVGTDLEGVMPELYDENGIAADLDDLEYGDVVVDDDGNEYVFVPDDGDEGFGKASTKMYTEAALNAMHPREAARLRGLGHGSGHGNVPGTKAMGEKIVSAHTVPGHSARDSAKTFEGAYKQRSKEARDVIRGDVKAHWARNKNRYYVGGGATTAAGVGGTMAYRSRRSGDDFGKSLGDEVYEQLSKSLNDYDRDLVISKAMDEIEIAKAEAAEARAQADYERDLRVTDEFISKAAEYNLPVAPEVFGPILKSLAEVLHPDDLDVLDQVFTATGDALYNEVGYVGESSNSSVIDYVSAAADELIGKADVSRELAMTAMFEANPEAYDAYINETNGRY